MQGGERLNRAGLLWSLLHNDACPEGRWTLETQRYYEVVAERFAAALEIQCVRTCVTSDLEIPAEAIQIVADHCFGEDKGVCALTEDAARDIAAAALDDAVPIVVAAELRRLAVPYGEREDICAGDRDRLLTRADELDPQGGAQ